MVDRKTANRLCDLCGKQIDRFSMTYSVNLFFEYDHSSRKKRYTFNEIKIVCRNCYLTSDKINRIGALNPQ